MLNKKPFDFWLFITVLILLSLGTVMVFSSSAPSAYNYLRGDTYYFLKKQLIYAPLSIFAMLFMMNVDYKKLGRLSKPLLIISAILLILVLIPGIGRVENGARRWFSIFGQSLQPSEMAKLSIILFFSYHLSKRKEQLQNFLRGFVPYLVLLGLFAGLLMLEPHTSCTIIIGLVAFIIMYCAGAKISHFVAISIPVTALLVIVIAFEKYRLARVIAFLDPFSDPSGNGYQAIQSLYAIGSGGLFGRGLGRSLQKFLYIPEPYNDFILSVLAEELGFIGVLAVMLLFLIFIWRGIKISMNAPDTFGSLTAIGVTALVAVQVIINVAVVTSSMPVTGMPLPFFSYGGTSLIFLMCGVGILLNISRYSNYERI